MASKWWRIWIQILRIYVILCGRWLLVWCQNCGHWGLIHCDFGLNLIPAYDPAGTIILYLINPSIPIIPWGPSGQDWINPRPANHLFNTKIHKISEFDLLWRNVWCILQHSLHAVLLLFFCTPPPSGTLSTHATSATRATRATCITGWNDIPFFCGISLPWYPLCVVALLSTFLNFSNIIVSASRHFVALTYSISIGLFLEILFT